MLPIPPLLPHLCLTLPPLTPTPAPPPCYSLPATHLPWLVVPTPTSLYPNHPHPDPLRVWLVPPTPSPTYTLPVDTHPFCDWTFCPTTVYPTGDGGACLPACFTLIGSIMYSLLIPTIYILGGVYYHWLCVFLLLTYTVPFIPLCGTLVCHSPYPLPHLIPDLGSPFVILCPLLPTTFCHSYIFITPPHTPQAHLLLPLLPILFPLHLLLLTPFYSPQTFIDYFLLFYIDYFYCGGHYLLFIFVLCLCIGPGDRRCGIVCVFPFETLPHPCPFYLTLPSPLVLDTRPPFTQPACRRNIFIFPQRLTACLAHTCLYYSFTCYLHTAFYLHTFLLLFLHTGQDSGGTLIV